MVHFLQHINFIFDIFPSTRAVSKPLWLVNFDGYFDSGVADTLAEVDYGSASSAQFFGKNEFVV